jgi:hypothetical protein
MMEKRGAKPKFTDDPCPNEACKFYGIPEQGNILSNGTHQIKNRRVRKYLPRMRQSVASTFSVEHSFSANYQN